MCSCIFGKVKLISHFWQVLKLKYIGLWAAHYKITTHERLGWLCSVNYNTWVTWVLFAKSFFKNLKNRLHSEGYHDELTVTISASHAESNGSWLNNTESGQKTTRALCFSPNALFMAPASLTEFSNCEPNRTWASINGNCFHFSNYSFGLVPVLFYEFGFCGIFIFSSSVVCLSRSIPYRQQGWQL